jgi:hypothetical protein
MTIATSQGLHKLVYGMRMCSIEEKGLKITADALDNIEDSLTVQAGNLEPLHIWSVKELTYSEVSKLSA